MGKGDAAMSEGLITDTKRNVTESSKAFGTESNEVIATDVAEDLIDSVGAAVSYRKRLARFNHWCCSTCAKAGALRGEAVCDRASARGQAYLRGRLLTSLSPVLQNSNGGRHRGRAPRRPCCMSQQLMDGAFVVGTVVLAWFGSLAYSLRPTRAPPQRAIGRE